MSRVRDIINSEDKKGPSPWMAWITGTTNFLVSNGITLGGMGYMYARHIGWFIVTTGMITALPLIFEIKRESIVEELEKLQIDAGLNEGRTPQELASLGLTSAVQPKVLN